MGPGPGSSLFLCSIHIVGLWLWFSRPSSVLRRDLGIGAKPRQERARAGRQGLYACCGMASPNVFGIGGRGVFRPISASNGTTRVLVVGSTKNKNTPEIVDVSLIGRAALSIFRAAKESESEHDKRLERTGRTLPALRRQAIPTTLPIWGVRHPPTAENSQFAVCCRGYARTEQVVWPPGAELVARLPPLYLLIFCAESPLMVLIPPYSRHYARV